MISPLTPPGAEVVCIDAAPGPYGDSGLEKGAVYTVDHIELGLRNRFVVLLVEVNPPETFAAPWGKLRIGFSLTRFRPLQIPKQLTELLQREPEHDLV